MKCCNCSTEVDKIRGGRCEWCWANVDLLGNTEEGFLAWEKNSENTGLYYGQDTGAQRTCASRGFYAGVAWAVEQMAEE